MSATVEETGRLEQPPEAVWEFIVKPENYPAYVEGYLGGEVLSEVREGVGLRFRWKGRTLGLTAESEEEVVEWSAPHRVRFEGRMAGVRFRSAMILEPSGGATLLTVRIDYEVPMPGIGWLAERALAPLVRRSVQGSLRRLCQRDHLISERGRASEDPLPDGERDPQARRRAPRWNRQAGSPLG